MATVMLSNKLTQSIIRNIQQPLRTKAAELKAAALKKLEKHADYVWDFYSKADQVGLNGCNPEYLLMRKSIGITIKTTRQTVSAVCALSSLRPVKFHWINTPGLTYQKGFPEYDEIISLLTEQENLEQEAKEIEPKMDALFKQCGSLADVIKIFPTVQDYLDNETKARLARPTVRKKDKPKELPKDLATSLVKSRIFASGT